MSLWVPSIPVLHSKWFAGGFWNSINLLSWSFFVVLQESVLCLCRFCAIFMDCEFDYILISDHCQRKRTHPSRKLWMVSLHCVYVLHKGYFRGRKFSLRNLLGDHVRFLDYLMWDCFLGIFQDQNLSSIVFMFDVSQGHRQFPDLWL